VLSAARERGKHGCHSAAVTAGKDDEAGSSCWRRLLWLDCLIVLLAWGHRVLSFRAAVGPRDYVASLAQYKTSSRAAVLARVSLVRR